MPTATSKTPRARRSSNLRTVIRLGNDWNEVFDGAAGVKLNSLLQAWLPSRRWFRGKARIIATIGIQERIPIRMDGSRASLVFVKVTYAEGGSESYVSPLNCAVGRNGAAIARDWPKAVLGHLSFARSRKEGMLYDAIVDKNFCRALLDLITQRRTVAGQTGDLMAEPTPTLRRIRRQAKGNMAPSVGKAEQSNSSIIYKRSLILKFFRRLDPGANPELEIERFLANCHFAHSPPFAGALEYRHHRGQLSTVAVLTSFVPGCHDAWEDTLMALDSYYNRVRKLPAGLGLTIPASGNGGPVGNGSSLPFTPADLVGSYMQDAATLGQRTAALHLALVSDSSNLAFRPKPLKPAGQRALFEALSNLTRDNFKLLRKNMRVLSPEVRALAKKVLSLEIDILERFRRITREPVKMSNIRTHGDYHLGQVLHHNEDFLIIDFEGEPALSLKDRRIKQSALRDVAGMIYSYFYAANSALRQLPNRRWRDGQEPGTAWARYWSEWVGTTFLRSYLETAGAASFIPATETTIKFMLDVELLRKAIYEIGYELNNRPEWLNISLQVLLDLLRPENPL